MLVVVDRKSYFWRTILFCSDEIFGAQRSVRVQGLRVRTSPASLPCVLEQDPFYPCQVLGQPRKTRPGIAEKIVYGDVKIQIKQTVA